MAGYEYPTSPTVRAIRRVWHSKPGQFVIGWTVLFIIMGIGEIL